VPETDDDEHGTNYISGPRR